MICAGHPEGVITLHPLGPYQDILKGIVKGMAHVELAGDVGRRNDYRKGCLAFIHLGMEKSALFPKLIKCVLCCMRIIGFGELVSLAHVGSPLWYFRFR